MKASAEVAGRSGIWRRKDPIVVRAGRDPVVVRAARNPFLLDLI